MNHVKAALEWEGTPYHHQARVKGAGVDCAQLVAAVHEQVTGASVVVPCDYSPEWHLHNREERLIAILEQLGCKEKPVEETKPGDILCFKFGRVISHLGIMLHAGMFIHARIDQGKVTINTLAADWKARHLRTFSFPEHTDETR